MAFQCHFEGCEKSFSRKSKLNDHLNTHTNNRPYRCDMCEKSYMKNSHLSVHKKVHFPPEFECPRCRHMFRTKDKLSKHQKTCLEYRCSTCGKKYKKRSWFDAHVKSHHVKTFNARKTRHVCEYCKFEFSKKGNLQTHIRSVHLLIKPFRCLCGKEYAHNNSLYRHKRKCILRKTDCNQISCASLNSFL
ncbi:hypothetical protein EHEL_030690 [Encephalitozoon hellem ATCC 50504]|uniref:Zinc finger domain-containing protein n=1 Tax=Encephalitozoon hellem TaxID=27973 RepID=A0A9Q9C7D9_ENCHE|nr:uncharacterized protein EHEL_030690 [Encephalitozoon hellem ATCC 50504]AFM97966.1 hypothetical protein EHEL_030690 [Encephalitozoon hellem ATCC 50504]UTX42770.1 hypothetical protein GPU96_03g04920 [Encephalitozoon hellem]WEL38229.1 zinc finger domain-containing protein [Encephalitozoon hellem]|eukprot:XP_003886947.1 hypothetical protein EHEL_030690 [Encephalitozoon hellem ATCC 50504]